MWTNFDLRAAFEVPPRAENKLLSCHDPQRLWANQLSLSALAGDPRRDCVLRTVGGGRLLPTDWLCLQPQSPQPSLIRTTFALRENILLLWYLWSGWKGCAFYCYGCRFLSFDALTKSISKKVLMCIWRHFSSKSRRNFSSQYFPLTSL